MLDSEAARRQFMSEHRQSIQQRAQAEGGAVGVTGAPLGLAAGAQVAPECEPLAQGLRRWGG